MSRLDRFAQLAERMLGENIGVDLLRKPFLNDFGFTQRMTKLHDHQKSGLETIIGPVYKGRVLLADGMGLGKTLQILSCLHMRPEWLPAIIVCPATIKHNWSHEVRKHIGRDSLILEGRQTRFEPAKPFTIVNYDIFPQWSTYLEWLKPKTIVIDEAQSLANVETRRTQALINFCKKNYIPHRIGISGLPANNRLLELWPILHIIRPDLFPDYEAFKVEYCDSNRSLELGEHLRRVVMVRRNKGEVNLPIPKMRREMQTVQLSDRAQYETAEKDFIRWLKRTDPTKVERARKSEKLVRVGYLRRLVARLKIPAVVNWLNRFLTDRPDEKIIVFAIHRKVIEAIAEQFKGICVVIDGTRTSAQRKEAIADFDNMKHIRIMLANIDAGGVGWNGTAASSALFVELPWSPSKLSQAEKRIDRLGQTLATVNYYLIAMNSIEETICKILQRKQQLLGDCFDGKKNRNDEWPIYDEFLTKMRSRSTGFFDWMRESFFFGRLWK